MFLSCKLTFLLSAVAGAMASTHDARSHHGRGFSRLDGLSKRDTYTGRATWYPTDTGPDACTGKNHQDSDWYIALNVPQFGDGSGCCGKQMRINYNGKSTVATCVDECASCPSYGQIDMTKGLFEFFTGGDLDIGEFTASWSYVDGDGGDPPPPPPPPPATHHTTPKATPPTPTPTPKPATHAAPTTHHTTTTTPKEEPTTSSTHHTSSTAKKDSTTSAKPSSSSAVPKPSSSVKPSASSSAEISFVSSAPSPDPAPPSGAAPGGVANVGSDTDGSGSDSDPDSDSGEDGGNGISGALTGSSNGVAAFGANTRSLAAAVLAIVAFNAL